MDESDSLINTIKELESERNRLLYEKEELIEAIRLTNEYSLLPAIDGWSWWDVYKKYAHPKNVSAMKDYCDQALTKFYNGK